MKWFCLTSAAVWIAPSWFIEPRDDTHIIVGSVWLIAFLILDKMDGLYPTGGTSC